MLNFVGEHLQNQPFHHPLHQSPFLKRRAPQKPIYCADNHSRTMTLLKHQRMLHLNPSLPLLPRLHHCPRRPPLNHTIATPTCWPLLQLESDLRSYDLISVYCLQKNTENIACPKHAHVLWVSLAKSGGRLLLLSSPVRTRQQRKSTSMMTGPRTLVTTFLGGVSQELNLLSPSIRRQPSQMYLACTIHPRNLRAFRQSRGASMPQYVPLNL